MADFPAPTLHRIRTEDLLISLRHSAFPIQSLHYWKLIVIHSVDVNLSIARDSSEETFREYIHLVTMRINSVTVSFPCSSHSLTCTDSYLEYVLNTSHVRRCDDAEHNHHQLQLECKFCADIYQWPSLTWNANELFEMQ